MKINYRFHLRNLSILVVLAVFTGIGIFMYREYRWKKFYVVEPNILYRSGTLKNDQIDSLINDYQVKTIVSFTYTNLADEMRVTNQNGAKHYFMYLSGDGEGPDDAFLRFLQIMKNEENYPVLVHCSAGVQRTGGAVALYRMFVQNWKFEDAIDEMVAKGNKGRASQIEQLRTIHEKLENAKTNLASVDSAVMK